VPRLASLSVERVWHEFSRILAAPDPVPSIILMDRLGVLAAVAPEGKDVSALTRLVARGAPVDGLLRLAALLTGDVVAFASRLKLSLAERDRLLALRSAPQARSNDDDVALRRLLADTPADVLIDRTWLSDSNGADSNGADSNGADSDGAAWDLLRERLRSLPAPVFPLEGRDVVALGVPQGPRVGELLRSVRSWWLDGGCTADFEACRNKVRRFLRQ
jgi:poly(A) polymerase